LDEDCRRLLEDLAEGLVRLRCSRADSLRRVRADYAKLVADGDSQPAEEDILRQALRM